MVRAFSITLLRRLAIGLIHDKRYKWSGEKTRRGKKAFVGTPHSEGFLPSRIFIYRLLLIDLDAMSDSTFNSTDRNAGDPGISLLKKTNKLTSLDLGTSSVIQMSLRLHGAKSNSFFLTGSRA